MNDATPAVTDYWGPRRIRRFLITGFVVMFSFGCGYLVATPRSVHNGLPSRADRPAATPRTSAPELGSSDTDTVRSALSTIPTIEDVRAALGPDARYYGTAALSVNGIQASPSSACSAVVGDVSDAWGTEAQLLGSRSDVYRVQGDANAFAVMDVYVFPSAPVAYRRMSEAAELAATCVAGSLHSVIPTTHHPAQFDSVRVDDAVSRVDGIRTGYTLRGTGSPDVRCFAQVQPVMSSVLMARTCGVHPERSTTDLMSKAVARTFSVS